MDGQATIENKLVCPLCGEELLRVVVFTKTVAIGCQKENHTVYIEAPTKEEAKAHWIKAFGEKGVK